MMLIIAQQQEAGSFNLDLYCRVQRHCLLEKSLVCGDHFCEYGKVMVVIDGQYWCSEEAGTLFRMTIEYMDGVDYL